MCNAEIIAKECIIRGINEEIHTFAHWKNLGYCVRRGEKSDIKFTIWKHASGKVDDETGEEKPGRMFMKNACFFQRSQVEPMKQ